MLDPQVLYDYCIVIYCYIVMLLYSQILIFLYCSIVNYIPVGYETMDDYSIPLLNGDYDPFNQYFMIHGMGDDAGVFFLAPLLMVVLGMAKLRDVCTCLFPSSFFIFFLVFIIWQGPTNFQS